ncbi:MAG: succinate dehydrogenase/fumarate reductase iron-sulfur subunit [Saprospiraceae bacterium]|jgi:succinate dehydrogenase / fumarate reductase iron-sulfur subunit|nr:succinate dehydrogenase/fumarate reductase iron-sulfur subunit [Saprospiraceae bacterium]MDC3210649.1 succinate dehydrogenase/fumarate reductase iron-sulfur subunit [Saprospiraceae bacterium]MDG1434921.1 succinate dehydrogenase/fumarate reductase iron-sulfur subunit [Saprospiraceae bacterium]MDG2419432.1 succinate dehydrogenase/fumarate reductase iron-sulfur subunit [Saprospiraceae bacterium]
MKIHLKVWRQRNGESKGYLEDHQVEADEHMSFLEMMDVLNEDLVSKKETPVAFEHDCREGICGSCNMVINGQPHGPDSGTTTCQLHMRSFKDGDTVVVEPWRAVAFPVIKDLIVDRSSFDRIIQAGGYISVNTGQAQDGNAIPIEKGRSAFAMDAAECIGCGACVAACPNASAMLFTSAKVAHLGTMPQGEVEQSTRVQSMVKQMDLEGFGMCSNTGACEAECPKGISITNIALMNRQYAGSVLGSEKSV